MYDFPTTMAQSSSPQHIAVLGGGIAGLAAAHRLASLGHRVRLFEQSGRIGGAVRSESAGGWLVECGPNSLQESSEEVAGWWKEFGLDGDRLEASPLAKNRYLVRNGRLVPVPMGPGSFFTTPLFSAGAKARLFGELFSRKRTRTGEASVGQFLRDHFGAEVVRYAVQPMISGIYAGDPERLSAREIFPQLWELERTHGSLLRGLIAGAKAKRAAGKKTIAKLISFRGGLTAFPEAVASRLPAGSIALKSRVERLVPGDGWRVIGSGEAGPFEERFDRVVSTLPAPALARLVVGAGAERPLASLEGIEHPAVTSLFLGYRRDQVAHPLDGFGALVPSAEKRSVIGILFSSSLFPGRAPEGHVGLTVMIGGMLQCDVARLPLERLLELARADLKDLVGATGEPVFVRHSFWPQTIPQYGLAHAGFRESIARCERSNPGLFVGGQAVDGISVCQCFKAGRALAERALAPA